MKRLTGRIAIHRWFALSGVLLLAFCCGCGDDGPTTPPPPALDDIALTLVIVPTTPLISESVTARIEGTGAGAQAVLAAAQISWGWTEEYSYLFDDLGRVEVQLQFFRPGQQEVRVRIQSGQQERLLSQTVQVGTGASDGSLQMIPLAAGSFLRGDDQSAFSLQRPQRQIELSAFSLARTEVTNATFASVIEWAVGRGWVDAALGSQFLVWTPVAGGQQLNIANLAESDLTWNGAGVAIRPEGALHPVSGVYWAGAAAVCNWLSEMEGFEPCYTFTPSNPLHLYTVTCDFARNGYRLPTEAEWEKAARGGLMLVSGANPIPDRLFPWGNDELYFRIDGNLDGDPPFANDIYGSLRANVAAPLYASRPFHGPIFGGSLPVGSFPDGRGAYGHDDLLGNIAEWCNDWFGYGYYADSPDVDPRGPATVLPSIDDFKAFRGDSWYGPYIPPLNAFSVEVGGSKRRWATYHYSAPYLGFRVARSILAASS